MSAGGSANQRVFMAKHGEVYIPPIENGGPRVCAVTVKQHPYEYWRAQCSGCGTVQNWATEDDANWWADRHTEKAEVS